jgi:hypothetical protein
MRTTNLYLLLFGVYNINNFQTILVHELGDWSKRWLMSFNLDKTEIMLFLNVENSTNFYFYFDRKLIQGDK